MTKIDKTIIAMAHELGDPGGFEFDTVDYIASELQISVAEVEAVLDQEAA